MNNLFLRVIGSTSILSIGHLVSALSMAGIKIFILYFYSDIFPRYSYIYSYYLTFQLIGIFNIHLVLLAKISNKDSNKNSNISLLINSLLATAIFSTLSNIIFISIMSFSGYLFLEILPLVITLILENLSFIFINYTISNKKFFISSFLIFLSGGLKIGILMILNLFRDITLTILGISFLIESLILLALSGVIVLLPYLGKFKIKTIKSLIKVDIIKSIIFSGFLILIVSLSYSVFTNIDYYFTKNLVGLESLYYVDPAFMVINFTRIVLNALIQSIIVFSSFFSLQKLLKKSLSLFILPAIVLSLLYFFLHDFISIDNLLFSKVFNIDNPALEQSIAIILLALSFQVVYSIGLGYGQGRMRHKPLAFISITSLVITIPITYILIKNIGFQGALWSFVIFSGFLGILHTLYLLFGYKKKISETYHDSSNNIV